MTTFIRVACSVLVVVMISAQDQPDHSIVQFAMDKIKGMAVGDSDRLQLLEVVSYKKRIEKLPFLPAVLSECHDMVLRIVDSVSEFNHAVSVTTSQGYTTITRYTCSYESQHRRYMHVHLPGSTALSHSALRVLSVNTWNYNNWERRLPLLKSVFDRYAPDVVAFQEVRSLAQSSRTDHRFMVDDLRALLPNMQFAFEPAMKFPDGDDIILEGLAVFSRFPIASVSVTQLTRDEDDREDFHQRIVLDAGLVLGASGVVHVLDTHLSLSETARARTMREVLEVVEAIRRQGQSVILLGDFNSEKAPKYFSDMTDAWAVHHQADSETGFTFDAWRPGSRIDYIFLSKDLEVRHCEVIGGEPQAKIPNTEDVLYASDHLFPFAIIEKLQPESFTSLSLH